jgi:Acetyl-CoA hydrolase/transferase C-terminal domain
VVLNLTPGDIVTAPRSDMMFVVTEFGLVNLKGKSIPERTDRQIVRVSDWPSVTGSAPRPPLAVFQLPPFLFTFFLRGSFQ